MPEATILSSAAHPSVIALRITGSEDLNPRDVISRQALRRGVVTLAYNEEHVVIKDKRNGRARRYRVPIRNASEGKLRLLEIYLNGKGERHIVTRVDDDHTVVINMRKKRS